MAPVTVNPQPPARSLASPQRAEGLGLRLMGLGAVLLWFATLAVVVTWPMPLRPVDTVLGHAEASASCHVWVLWWAQHHIDQLQTDLIFFPAGADVVTLYGSDVLSPALLRWLPAPPALLYNAWVLSLLWLSGLGMYSLARDRGATTGGALVAGTVLASAPFFQHEALNGTSEILAAGLLTWFTLALCRVLELPASTRAWWRPASSSLLWGLALGLSCGVAVAASAYSLFFCLLIAGVLTLSALATRSSPIFHRSAVAALAAAVVAVAPAGLALAWLQITHGAGQVYSRRELWTSPELSLPDSFAELDMWLDRSAAVIPAVRELPGGDHFEYWTTSTVYLGVVAVGLAAWGLWHRRRDRPVGTFAALAVVAALVASGPTLRLAGTPLTLAGHSLGMPGLLAAKVFPPFVITAIHSYRYTAVVIIGLALLAGYAVRSRRAGVILSLLVLLDAVVLSPVPWPAPTVDMTRFTSSQALLSLGQAPPGAVLHLPIEEEKLGDLGVLLLAQTQHGKPVQDGGIHRRAGTVATALFTDVPLVGDLARRATSSDLSGLRLPGARTTSWSLGQLYAAGYRYVLAEQLPASGEPPSSSELRAWLDGALGPATAQDQDWVWWQIPPQQSAAAGESKCGPGSLGCTPAIGSGL